RPRSTAFPYTTLFRSRSRSVDARTVAELAVHVEAPAEAAAPGQHTARVRAARTQRYEAVVADDADGLRTILCRAVAELPIDVTRSEEHTSELQSREKL